MARRNATDETPDALLEALDFIEENTGLLGDANPGSAHLSVGGTTLMVTSDRTAFDEQGMLLDYIDDKDSLRINHISIRKSSVHPTRPFLQVVAEE